MASNVLNELFEVVSELQANDTIEVVSRNEAYPLNADDLPEHANEQVKKFVRAKVLGVLKPRERTPRGS